MSIKETPNKQTAEALVSMLLAGGQEAKTTGEGLTLRYAPPDRGDRRHTLWLGRADGKTPTDKQEQETRDTLLLALRELARQGGHVVTVYPARGRYRSTISGQLCVPFIWQSAPTSRLLQLGREERRQALRWITAAGEQEKEDRLLLQGSRTAQRQAALL